MEPLSKRQVDKLGERLRSCGIDDISDEDRALFARLIEQRETSLRVVEQRLRDELGLVATGRLKTLITTVEKLQREPLNLSAIRDIAGARLVVPNGRLRQDDVAASIAKAFECEARDVIDRRAAPSFGYRAVHVIVRVDRAPVEVQVRTKLQQLWAELSERTADRLGRGIRYGAGPRVQTLWSDHLLNLLATLSDLIDRLEIQECELERDEARLVEEIREQLLDAGMPDDSALEPVVADAAAAVLEERRREINRLHDEIERLLESLVADAESL